MKIKRKNLTRLASISALGAGALGVGAGTAEAGIVYTPINTKVGFSPGSQFSFSFFPGGGIGGFSLYTNYRPNFRGFSGGYSISVFLKIVLSGLSGMKFQPAPGPGAIWNGTPFNGFSFSTVLNRTAKYKYFFGFTTTRSVTKHTVNGATSFTAGGGVVMTPTHVYHPPHYSSPGTNFGGRVGDYYLLFTFNPTGSQIDYGWLHLSGDPIGPCGCGPDVTVIDASFDDSGAPVGAGTAPEPATAIPTGLGALALGAAGVRRWRAQRKQSAQTVA